LRSTNCKYQDTYPKYSTYYEYYYYTATNIQVQVHKSIPGEQSNNGNGNNAPSGTNLNLESICPASSACIQPLTGLEQANLTACNNLGSCFHGSTTILMSDGTNKMIKDIQQGDEVRTAEGVAKVMYLEVRKTGGRSLYGFNGEEPFFTEEHMFATTSGFRSLNVEAMIAEDPSYKSIVQPLRIGDDLLVSNESKQSQRVNSFTQKDVDFETRVYNLVLNTGHTFYANGYCVSDLFPRLDQFPFSFKMLHWFWRERGVQINEFFEKHLGKAKDLTSSPLIHDDKMFQNLFERLKQTVDSFIEESTR